MNIISGPKIWKENERKDQKITEDDRKKSGPAYFHVLEIRWEYSGIRNDFEVSDPKYNFL